MKKITIIEIIVALLVLAALAIYFIPQFLIKKEDKIMAQIKTTNAIFTSKVIEEFSHNKNSVPSEVAKKITEELNSTEKNPYSSKRELFQLGKDIKSCSNIEYDDNLKMIIITTLDKNGELVARIVINPPSFITYYKEGKKN